MWEPQTSYIFDDNDKLIVDYMGKTETLQQDLDNIIEEINKRNPENVTYITREYLESLEEEKLDIEEYIKSAIKKYDGSENSLDNVSKKIMRKVLKK